MAEKSTKPYLVRAIHEWCSDSGLTPYISVQVNAETRVPAEYVKNGEIVLNVGSDATHRLTIGNERGAVIVHVEPRPGQQRGVVVVEGVWPNKHFENGIGINALTSSDPGYPHGGAVFHDTAVWLRKAGA